MEDATYEVEDDSYEIQDFETKQEAESFVQGLVESGQDETDITVYKVTRESVDFTVDKEVTVSIY